jgi:hypothetical protein
VHAGTVSGGSGNIRTEVTTRACSRALRQSVLVYWEEGMGDIQCSRDANTARLPATNPAALDCKFIMSKREGVPMHTNIRSESASTLVLLVIFIFGFLYQFMHFFSCKSTTTSNLAPSNQDCLRDKHNSIRPYFVSVSINLHVFSPSVYLNNENLDGLS